MMITHTHRSRAGALGLILVALATGCAKKEAAAPASTPAPAAEVAVVAVDLGNHIDAGKRVSAPMTVFSPTDTVFASVSTSGTSPSATLTAAWTFGPGKQAVSNGSETIAPVGPAWTEFHISKPSGWPKGTYQVDIALNGATAMTKSFEVK